MGKYVAVAFEWVVRRRGGGINRIEMRRAVTPQYAVLIYSNDSAHAPESTPEDRESCVRHSDELVERGSMAGARIIRLGAFGPRGWSKLRGGCLSNEI
jgi:hypothetical protein